MVKLPIIALCLTGCISIENHVPVDPSSAARISLGLSRQEVQALLGGPHHMTRTFEHPKGCVERWSYVEFGLITWVRNYDALLVDFDEQGRVCDVTSLRAQQTQIGR